MLLEHSILVLDRHGIARKGHHASTRGEVRGIERRDLQYLFGQGSTPLTRRVRNRSPTTPCPRCLWNLRDFRTREGSLLLRRASIRALLSSVHQPFAVRLPERFRGGCAFGSGAMKPRSLPRESTFRLVERERGVKAASPGPGDRLEPVYLLCTVNSQTSASVSWACRQHANLRDLCPARSRDRSPADQLARSGDRGGCAASPSLQSVRPQHRRRLGRQPTRRGPTARLFANGL